MVKIVTDSCSDIPSQMAQQLGITVVPLSIRFGDEIFRDGIDLSTEEFYDRLVKGPAWPKTISPSPGDFVETYGRLAAETNEIVSVHISARLSGTYNSARLGKELLKQACRIEVIDSLMASMGVGLLAIIAAKAALAGANLDQVTALIREAMPRTHYFGFVDSLEYLHKGGRLGKGQVFLGSMLNIKPLLHVQDGEVHPLERVRSRPKAFARLCELTKNSHNIEEMVTMHSTTPDEARKLNTLLLPLVPEGHVYEATVGPTIGTYLGPGALAIGIIEGK